MYRVFLVDDEPFIVEGLSDAVDWSAFGLELCGTAENGRQALEKLQVVPADILITDITMPFMNGLELIGAARRIRPDIKVIVLSGYNEFDYLKEGMRLGIENYLLKPIHFEELFDTLQNTVEKLNAFRSKSDYSEEEIDILRDNVLYRWMTDKIGAEQLRERALLLGIRFDEPYVMTGIVRHKGRENMLRLMRRRANGDPSVLCFRDMDDDYVAAFMGESPESCKRKAVTFMSDLRMSPESEGCGISLGSVEAMDGGARRSYGNAQKAQEYLLLLGRAEIASYDEIPLSRSDDMRTVSLDWAEYASLLLARDLDRLLDRIDSDFRNAQSVTGITPEDVRGIAIEAMVRMKMDMQKLKYGESASGEMRKSLFRRASQATDLNELLEAVKAAARISVEELTKEDKSPIVKQVLKHLDSRYAEDLSLKSLGRKFNVHPVYLGRLFQREAGEAFTERLNKIRIEKAKEMLRQTTLKVHEVSREVGYWEPSYFHKQFKKYVGVTPSEFKGLI